MFQACGALLSENVIIKLHENIAVKYSLQSISLHIAAIIIIMNYCAEAVFFLNLGVILSGGYFVRGLFCPGVILSGLFCPGLFCPGVILSGFILSGVILSECLIAHIDSTCRNLSIN